ncbi:MAG: aconitase family protein, partial [Pseudomonas sp.]
MGRTLFTKLWDSHVVKDLGDGWALLHIDRHLLHDLSGAPALSEMGKRKLAVHNPELTFATPDHVVSSAPGRNGQTYPVGAMLWAGLKHGAAKAGMRFFELGQPGQGIVHVMGPELGIVLPGTSVVCGDSHTCTNGGMGALAFGIGSSEAVHVLATQTLRQQRPKNMRINVEGALPSGVTAKDIILHLLGKLGASAGVGYAIEFAGSTIRALSIEARLTLCNLSVEMGAKFGLVAPDDTTFAFLRDKPYAPQGPAFDRALEHWRQLLSDDDARFDAEFTLDANSIVPTLTWGTSPDQAIAIDQPIPNLNMAHDEAQRDEWQAALDYMGLQAGGSLLGTPVD